MDLEILRKIGVSDGEIKIYNVLLGTGATSVDGLNKKTGVDRRNIYDILNKLIERGFVSYMEENGKKTFRASNPESILNYLDEKRSDLEGVKEEITKLIPSIQQLLIPKPEEQFAEIFRGSEGMKSVWNDMLNYDAIYWIGSGLYVPERYPAFWKDWNKRRIKKRVESYNLIRHEKRGAFSEKEFKNFKFLPKEFSGNPTVTVIYGNKVVQQLFSGKMFFFVITSRELAENYKRYHRFLWDKVAKP